MVRLGLFGALLAVALSAFAAGKLTTEQVKEQVIRESIARYPGNCACPDSRMSNGNRCGGRSAYSRGGGHAPLCYPEDVTPEMVNQWRARNE